MTVKDLLLTVLSLVAISDVQGKRFISKQLDRPLTFGDEVHISGIGNSRFPGIIRLFDGQKRCRNVYSVNPLFMTLKTRRHQISFHSKLPGSSDCIIKNLGEVTIDALSHNIPFKVIISVASDGFEVRMNSKDGPPLFKTTDGIGNATIIRGYAGNYKDVTVKRFSLPQLSYCGTRITDKQSAISSRLSGGTEAEPGEYPWQASIRKYKRYAYSWDPILHLCGATIIANCWVLTAAHCTDRKITYERRHRYYVRFGDYDNSESTGTNRRDEDQQDLEIENVFQHENFSMSGASPINDIALIQLVKTNGSCSTFGYYAVPACLPDAERDVFYPGSQCEISGWGAQETNQDASKYPTRLQKGKVPLKEFIQCRKAYGKNNGENLIKNGMICAGGDVDTCQGDSGGPLVCIRKDPNSRYSSQAVLWGITSWGEECSSPDKPGVYTEVVKYLDWINLVIATNHRP